MKSVDTAAIDGLGLVPATAMTFSTVRRRRQPLDQRGQGPQHVCIKKRSAKSEPFVSIFSCPIRMSVANPLLLPFGSVPLLSF
jgi:hypothetical protein